MITELRGAVREEDDEKTLAWTMELIAKEQLYAGSSISQVSLALGLEPRAGVGLGCGFRVEGRIRVYP